MLAAFACFALYAAFRPDLHWIVGRADHDRFVAEKLLTPAGSSPIVVCGNSRALFAIQCGRFDTAGLPTGSRNLAIPALRYSAPYLAFIDQTLATDGPRAVVLCLGERNFWSTERPVGFNHYLKNGASLRAAASDATARRLAAIPIDAISESWTAGAMARINADRRKRFEGGSFRSDGSAVVDLRPDEASEPHEAPPDDLHAAAEGIDRDGGTPSADVLRAASLDPDLVAALLDAVRTWSNEGVTVAYLRMPDRSDGEEGRGRSVSTEARTAAFAALGRALDRAGAVGLRPSFEGLRTWDGVHMDGASAATFTERLAGELRRVMPRHDR